MREKRYWYGYLENESEASIVIWDWMARPLPEDEVYLYHAKKEKIIRYKKDSVRKFLKPLPKEMYTEAEATLEKYVDARSIQSSNWQEYDENPSRSTTENEIEIPQWSPENKTCYLCDGKGFEYGAYGSLACPVCLGSGKLSD